MGPVVGAIVLTLLPEMLHRFEMYRLIIYGIIIIIVLYILPKGVWGEIEGYFQKRKKIKVELIPKGGKKLQKLTEFTAILKSGMGISKDVILKTNGVTMKFGGLVAIDHIGLEVRRGCIHSIIGPNGAGKTTLLNLISGVYSPMSGDVLFESKNINRFKPYQLAYDGLARTFQNVQLFTDLSALDNTMIGFQPHFKKNIWQAAFRSKSFKREELEIKNKAIELLEFVGMERYMDTVASKLPYGYQRKLEIARALATKPRLLLLDEPAAGLNAGEIEELDTLIKQIQNSGITIMLVEHHVDLGNEHF